MSDVKLCPLSWEGEKLVLLDQRKLPSEVSYVHCFDLLDCYKAIETMVVRGAPLIGFTAIFGLALWLKNNPHKSFNEFLSAARALSRARPTAINLVYEIERILSWTEKSFTQQELWKEVARDALEQMSLLEQSNRQMACAAEKALESLGLSSYRLMTLCNTGFLACGTLGTALGVITHLHEKGRLTHVYASETRPYFQGLRLTGFELQTLKIPHSIVVEGAASYLMREKLVDAIFVGADRIVANGDTANKIGTASLAAVAKYYNVPFYVVAPTSSFDLSLNSGGEIPIELRDPEEILSFKGERLAAPGCQALNPSFDVTSADLIAGIFCEKGLISPVNSQTLSTVLRSAHGI